MNNVSRTSYINQLSATDNRLEPSAEEGRNIGSLNGAKRYVLERMSSGSLELKAKAVVNARTFQDLAEICAQRRSFGTGGTKSLAALRDYLKKNKVETFDSEMNANLSGKAESGISQRALRLFVVRGPKTVANPKSAAVKMQMPSRADHLLLEGKFTSKPIKVDGWNSALSNDRPMAVCETDSGLKIPMYRSTGANSQSGSTWFPFVGVSDKIDKPFDWATRDLQKSAKFREQHCTRYFGEQLGKAVLELLEKDERKRESQAPSDFLVRIGNLESMCVSARIGGGMWDTDFGKDLIKLLKDDPVAGRLLVKPRIVINVAPGEPEELNGKEPIQWWKEPLPDQKKLAKLCDPSATKYEDVSSAGRKWLGEEE